MLTLLAVSGRSMTPTKLLSAQHRPSACTPAAYTRLIDWNTGFSRWQRRRRKLVVLAKSRRPMWSCGQLKTDILLCLQQSREWVTQSDPWPKWPIELLTHDPCDPWPMGHRGRHPILAQALRRFIDYPALYLDIVYVHIPLSCYIIAHVSKLHI